MKDKFNYNQPVQAITICIFFSDHLKYCITNKSFFDEWIIVTVEEDIDTIKLCEEFSLKYVFTQRAFADGATLAKGKAINDGISHLKKAGWIIQLDCDVILPPNFRECVNSIPLNESNLQSLFSLKGRRVLGAPPKYQFTRSINKYKKFHKIFNLESKANGRIKKESISFDSRKFKNIRKKEGIDDLAGSINDQWNFFIAGDWKKLNYIFEGYEVSHLGYFQMFHSENFNGYPENSKDVYFDDTDFRNAFKSNRLKTLKLDCVHICLPASGSFYIVHLNHVFMHSPTTLKHDFYQQLKKYLNKNRPKLTYSRKPFKIDLATSPFYLPHLPHALTREENSSPDVCFIWARFINYKERSVRAHNNNFLVAHEYNINKKSDWFRISFLNDESNKNYQFNALYFDMCIEKINCDLEIGLGNDKKFDWSYVQVSKLEEGQWYTFKIDLKSTKSLSSLDSLFAIRNVGISRGGKIYLSNIFYI